MRRFSNRLRAAAVASVLLIARAATAEDQVCGDVNENGSVTTSDALAVLRNAVGQPVSLDCPDFVRRIGNVADTNKDSEYGADFLLGMPVVVEQSATVTHFGLISRVSGTHGKLALYTDDGGEPDELVVGSASTEVVVGSQEIPVAATPIAAGTYWIMGVYDADTLLASDEQAPNGNLIRYRALPFGNAFPAVFGPAIGYDNNKANYWIKVIE